MLRYLEWWPEGHFDTIAIFSLLILLFMLLDRLLLPQCFFKCAECALSHAYICFRNSLYNLSHVNWLKIHHSFKSAECFVLVYVELNPVRTHNKYHFSFMHSFASECLKWGIQLNWAEFFDMLQQHMFCPFKILRHLKYKNYSEFNNGNMNAP